LAEVVGIIETDCGQKPELLVTSASLADATLTYSEARERIQQGRPLLILFGTGWGLTKEVLAMADSTLAPIQGFSHYNHLSVRSAVAIILDRLMGRINER
jgi:hypothetical protein